MYIRYAVSIALAMLSAAGLSGCLKRDAMLHYLGDAELSYYNDAAQTIDYPVVDSALPEPVAVTEAPRTIADRTNDEVRELTLDEALRLALANNPVIRSNAQFLSPGNSLLTNPDFIESVYDPAIQDSGVLFGGRGVESALSEFDPRLSASMIWGKDELIQNNIFFGGGLAPGSELTQDTGEFRSQLSKQFAYGSQFAVFHTWNYRGTNAPGTLFPSAYTGLLGAEYRQPLLAGAGTEFTRIAGPIANAFGGLTGVNQGVVIARINSDITIAELEQAVHGLLKETEDLYWELYLQYRLYETVVTARNSALDSWRRLDTLKRLDADVDLAAVAQALDQYFQTRALAQQVLSTLYRTELRLRRLMGLPVNDGSILRPATEPTTAPFVPDWELSLAEALTRRVELRRHKFGIKSLELQLAAAESLVRPRMDFVSNYRVNAFGDHLLGQNDNDGASAQGLNSAYETLTQGNQTGWNLGLEMTMNLGFRSALAQVRNIELRLAKARDILAMQEMEIAHELANAFQTLAETHAVAESSLNRINAAKERERIETERFRVGTQTADLVLRAQASVAEAERDFYTAVVDYNRAIADVYYRKGMLLDYNNVQLAEGEWTPDAYLDALRRARARSHAHPDPLLCAEPEPFVLPGYDGTLTAPPDTGLQGVPEAVMPPAPQNADEWTPDAAPQPLPMPYDDELPGDASGGEANPVPSRRGQTLSPAPMIWQTAPGSDSPIKPAAAVEPRTRPAPGWSNPFFEDSERDAPFDEPLDLRPGRDLID